ncbi:12946_t:CDS:2, partial [Acaulospora colombiana]
MLEAIFVRVNTAGLESDGPIRQRRRFNVLTGYHLGEEYWNNMMNIIPRIEHKMLTSNSRLKSQMASGRLGKRRSAGDINQHRLSKTPYGLLYPTKLPTFHYLLLFGASGGPPPVQTLDVTASKYYALYASPNSSTLVNVNPTMAQSSSSGIPIDVEEAVRTAGYTISTDDSPSQLSFPSKQPTTVIANTTSSPSRRIVKTVTQSTTSLPRSVIVTHVEGDNASSIHDLQQDIQSIRSRTFSGQSGASVLSAQLANNAAISNGIYGWSSTTSFVDNAHEGQRSVVSLAVPYSPAGKAQSVTSTSVANLVHDENNNAALPDGFIRKHTVSTTSSRVETKSLAPSHTSSTRYSVVVSGGDAPAGNSIMKKQVFSTSSRSLVSVTSQTSRVVVKGSSSQANNSAVISGEGGAHCSTTDLVSTQTRTRLDSESAPSEHEENSVVVSKGGQNGNLFVTKNVSGMKSTTSVVTTTSVDSHGANRSTTNVVSTSQGRSRRVSTESAPEEIVSTDITKANNSSCVNLSERSRRDSVESAPSELGEHVQDVVVPSKRQSTTSTKAPVKRSSYIAPPECTTPHRSATATPTKERPHHTRSGSAESAPSDLDHIPDAVPKPTKRQSTLGAQPPSKRSSYIAPTPRSNTPQRSATATPTQGRSYPVRSESPDSAPSDLDHVPDVAPGSKNPYKRTSVNAPKTDAAADDSYSTNRRGGFGIHRSNTVDDATNRNVPRRDSTDSAESAPSELDHAQGVPVATSRPPSKRQSLVPVADSKDVYGRRTPQRSATSVVPPEPCHEKSDSIHSAPSELDHAQAGTAYGNKSDRRVSRSPVPVNDPPVRGYSIDSVKSPFEEHCEPQPTSKPNAELPSDQPRYVPFAFEREPPVETKNIPTKPAVAPVKHGRTISMESIDLAPSRPNPPKRTRTLDPTCEEPPTRQSMESARSAPSQLGHGTTPAVPYEMYQHRLPSSASQGVFVKPKPSKARRSHKTRCWINLWILLAYITGAIFALGHHLFLASIHQKDVLLYSQFWVKNLSNAFSQAVSITLGFAVTLCITEGVWKAIRAGKTDSEVTSDLFALPSGTSIFAFMKRRWKFTWIILVFLAVVYNLLAFVSMFAPNALSVGPRDITSDVPVPNLNLSAVPAENGSNGWSTLMRHQITTPVADNWNVPAL